ncbi:MAG: phage tail sheath subtilisin-like domain-containing protein [Anaerolineales bacterium]|jgi:hypothetical protein|nr:phage tail sheath subtilisin-like domain-containing protein [Anaerolineales bacterium]
MVDLVSPGIAIKEKDLTTSVRNEPTSIGGIAIIAEKGPVDQVVTISSEQQLVNIFGKPNTTNHQYWYSAASFLMYSNTLKVVRIETTGAVNACASGTPILIKNNKHYTDGDGSTGPYDDGSANVGVFAARSAGSWGNSLRVEMCNTAAGYSETAKTTTSATEPAGEVVVALTSATGFAVGDIIYLQEADGQKYRITALASLNATIVRYPTAAATGLASAIASGTNVDREWRWAEQFERAPGTSQYATDRGGANDELHIIMVDENAGISGVENEVLEKFEALSKAADGLTDEGNANYYADVLYLSSDYVYWMDHPAGATNWGSNAGATTFSAPTAALDASSLTGGVGGTTAPTEGQRQLAYSRHFSDPDIEDVNILLAGPATVDNAGGTVHGVFMTDLVEKRKDCVACISPDKTDVVNVNNSYTQSTNVKSYFDLLSSSSYTIFDSGYTKQYDKYNDVYRWIPLNGHIGGSCARTDYLEDPWWSPAGLTRGQIRGSVAIAFNPAQVERDLLYRARINPVVTFPGEGTMLYGDKTGLSRNSAFSRINVRRLFLTIEEAIKVAARSVLFEFNDQFTRDSFKAMVDPYLRDVQSRRGIIDYLIVCDETNNTGQVIDNNEFRADFYIKPARSINFVTLTFIATRTGVDFAEVVGRA